jgi:hypothetical protein
MPNDDQKSPPWSPQERDELAAGVAFYALAAGALGGLVYGVIRLMRWLAALVGR